MKPLFLIASAALLLAACSSARRALKAENTIEGSWTLSVFQPTQKKTLAEYFGSRTIEMTFSKDSGRVSGSTGCNRFNGGFTMDTINISFPQNMAMTRMACPGYDENLFLNALHRVDRYKIVEGQLEFRQRDEIVMIFARKL